MGKSTLLKTIMGLLPTESGRILLGGKELSGCRPYQRVAAGLAYVPQGRMIFSNLTVLENLNAASRGPIAMSTYDEIYGLFPVLRDMRNRKGGNLSGGQQQQLAIARALLTNPQVLVLDEPTEGIQPSIIKDIARNLREIRSSRGLTIVVTEQLLSFVAAACDRLIVLQRGKVVHEDRVDGLNSDAVRELLAI
jgi:urea transport system ATP-binding protein